MALGRILREAREQRQLTLSQVAAATRMKVQVAQALESEDFRKIPAPIYGRGFIRMYAEFVGVDPKPLVAEYMAAVSGPVEQPAPGTQARAPKSAPSAAVAPAVAPVPAPRPPHVKAIPIVPEPTQPSGAEPATPEPPVEPPPAPAAEPADAPMLAAPPPPAPPAETAPAPAPRQGDDLFAWGQTAATKEPVEAPGPPPSPPPNQEPAPSVAPSAQAEMAEPVPPSSAGTGPVETVVPSEPAVKQESPPPPEPQIPKQKSADDLFAAATPLARPPKTTLGSQPPAYQRRPLQYPEPGEKPKLYREREAIRTRIVLVLIGVVIVAIFLISALTKCKAPPKEVKRGPVKEQLKLAVEPPAPYVD